jgi:hypothetical protein
VLRKLALVAILTLGSIETVVGSSLIESPRLSRTYNVRYGGLLPLENGSFDAYVVWYDDDIAQESAGEVCKNPLIEKVYWGTLGEYLKAHGSLLSMRNLLVRVCRYSEVTRPATPPSETLEQMLRH